MPLEPYELTYKGIELEAVPELLAICEWVAAMMFDGVIGRSVVVDANIAIAKAKGQEPGARWLSLL